MKTIKQIIKQCEKDIEEDVKSLKFIKGIDFIDIFPISQEHRQLLDDEAKTIATIIEKSGHGNFYVFNKPVETRFGLLKIFRIRMFDETKLNWVAAPDFATTDYNAFVELYKNDNRFTYIEAPTYNGLEFKTPKSLICFFSELTTDYYKVDKYFNNENVADNDSELLQVLDGEGTPTGRLEKREFVHSNKLFHNEVALWIIDKENKRVLLQRRSPHKKQNPNKLAICAGHVVGNETLEEALAKEAKEELGLDIKKHRVKKLITIKRTAPQNHCFIHHYYICETIPIQNFTIQKEELEEVIYMDYEVLKKLVKQGSDELAFEWSVYEPIFKKIDEIIYK